jgi:glyoxylase I family protein
MGRRRGYDLEDRRAADRPEVPTMPTESELVQLESRRAELREKYLVPADRRPPTPGRGIHHAALICSNVEQTIQFYQGLLEFPLVELVENRDYQGSTHFFFDLGNQTLLGFFDFPGLGLQPGVESIGSVQHIAISVPRDRWEQLRRRLDEAGATYFGPEQGIPESMYFKDPDGIQVELLSDPLMYFGGRQLDE